VRFDAGLRFSFLLAVMFHGFVVLCVTFTLSVAENSPKPAFIFLGSFLRQQDVMLPADAGSDVRAELDLKRIDLDSARGAWAPGVQKPSLAQKALPQKKSQYKPVVAVPIAPVPSPSSNADLGIELEPPVPVRMKMNRHD
jgi:hypothetical protein